MNITRTYLLYEGPGDLYIEMGVCPAVPAVGAAVKVDGKQFVVASVEWDVYTRGDDRLPPDNYPQQCATVKLKRKR